jgi:hypothetical protein
LDNVHDRGSQAVSPDMQQATVNIFADMGVQPATLQAGLVAATPTTDTTPPTSSIATPANNAIVTSPSIISITATDVGGVVGGVEIGIQAPGDTTPDWFPATRSGSNWTYTLFSGAVGVHTISTRAIDDSGNIEAALTSITLDFQQAACPCSLWNLTPSVGPDSGTPDSYELGVKFQSSENGFITALRFYKYPGNTGQHIGRLWSSTGTLLAQATFVNETTSGWQEVALPSPVAITANTTYIASYSTQVGRYAFSENYFASQGWSAPPLTALQNGIDGSNGVFNDNPGSFPTSTFNAANRRLDNPGERCDRREYQQQHHYQL